MRRAAQRAIEARRVSSRRATHCKWKRSMVSWRSSFQTERFGTSIGQALRIHADGLRTRQDLRATEIASQLPVKLLFPLIFLLFRGSSSSS